MVVMWLSELVSWTMSVLWSTECRRLCCVERGTRVWFGVGLRVGLGAGRLRVRICLTCAVKINFLSREPDVS